MLCGEKKTTTATTTKNKKHKFIKYVLSRNNSLYVC